MRTDAQHFARTLSYEDLVAGLTAAQAERTVYCRNGPVGLQIWHYTNSCVYDRKWDAFSLIARGLILDTLERTVVATPFPKFFNLGEMENVMPDGSFEVFEKLDGSLIILFHHQGRWQATTRGAFQQRQALWAEDVLARIDTSALVPGTTYLAEAVYADNRIIVSYPEDALVLLSAYDPQGYELPIAELERVSGVTGLRLARRYPFASQAELVANVEGLPEQEEGYVVRFADGQRIKLKGPAYCHLHAIVSRVTPLGIWDMMMAGEDLGSVRRRIPEELWWDFDAIVVALERQLSDRVNAVARSAETVSHLSDKDVGLRREEIPAEIFSRLFVYRRNPDLLTTGKGREGLLREIRPVGNHLPGYVPSHSLANVISEEG